MLDAQVVIDFLKRTFDEGGEGVSAHWVETEQSRSEFCDTVAAGISHLPILAAPVNSGEFQDANGIIDDLAQVLERHRAWFDPDRRAMIARQNRFTILLISRRPLNVPQISSPVQLPDWFPVWPSNLLTVTIRNITNSVDLSIGDPLVPIGLIGTALLDLEQALQSRLRWIQANHPGASSPLWARTSTDKGALGSMDKQLDAAEAAWRDVSDPCKFRPGGGPESPFLISRIFRLWWKSSPNDLHALSIDLASALCLSGEVSVPKIYSLATLLSRTAKPPLSQTPVGVTFCRNAIVSLANAMQLSTAAAHAGDYPRFPAVLTTSFLQDVAGSCQRTAMALDRLSS